MSKIPVLVIDDIIDNCELSAEDVGYLRECLGDAVDIDIIINLLEIAHELDSNMIDASFKHLLAEKLRQMFVVDNVINNQSAKELINLFDPDDELGACEREALKMLKSVKYDSVLENFLDARCI